MPNAVNWDAYQDAPAQPVANNAPQIDWNSYQSAPAPTASMPYSAGQQAMIQKIQSSPITSIPLNVATGAANTIYNAINAPYHWLTGKTVPNPTQLTGQQGTGLLNSFAHTIGEYAPINPVADEAIGLKIASPIANLAANAGTAGLIHGAIYNPDTPITSGAKTGVINAASSLIPVGAIGLTKLGANQVAKQQSQD